MITMDIMVTANDIVNIINDNYADDTDVANNSYV